jgi:hypothetical protein
MKQGYQLYLLDSIVALTFSMEYQSVAARTPPRCTVMHQRQILTSTCVTIARAETR